MRFRFSIGIALMCATITIAHAEDLSLWNFRGQMPASATAKGLALAETLQEGLHINAGKDGGYIVWGDKPVPAPTDVITLNVINPVQTEAILMWMDETQKGFYEMPFQIPGSDFAQNIDVIVSNNPNWNWKTQAIGIRFPAGPELLITEMDFRHWDAMERLIEGWKSFWTFDDFRAYSINFLWGPLIATNGPARAVLFDTLPPPAWSATRIFYVVLALAAIIGIIMGFVRRNHAITVGIVALTAAGLWLIFDLRMGLEQITYGTDDIQSYVMKSGQEKILRTHGNMYAALDMALPIIQQHDRFALFTAPDSIVYPNLRYKAYPSVAVLDGQSMSGVALFAVFERPDIKIDPATNRLWKPSDTAKFPDGREFLSPPGSVTLRFDDGTYLFTANQ